NVFDLLEGDAEFVFVSAGGNFGVGAGVHVRVHAHGDRRDLVQSPGDAVDALQLRLALDVEGINSAAQGEFEFRFGLADAGESAFPGRTTGRQHSSQFAFTHDIKAAPEVGDCAQHGEVRVRLDRVANEVFQRRQGGVELPEMFCQGVLRIDVKRRAELFDQRLN